MIFIGINNSSSVLPYVATERTVMYRERFAGMYSPWAYSLAQVRKSSIQLENKKASCSLPESNISYLMYTDMLQVIVEIPYLFIQSVLYLIVTYPMIGYYGSAYKIFWYFYAMFCSLLYFNYLGMLLVALTPNFMLAAILSSAFYTNFNLFAGFLIPKPVSQ